MTDDEAKRAKNKQIALEVLEKAGYATRCPEHGELVLTEKGKNFQAKLKAQLLASQELIEAKKTS